MAPQTGTALVLLVAFVLPGFVTVLIQERTFKSAEDPTPLDRLLRALYYSVWVYLLLAVLALSLGIDRPQIERVYERYDQDPAELVWRAALLILVPALLLANATRLWAGSRAQRRLLKLLRINERHEVPTAWDHFFAQGREAHIRVTLNDGVRVLGYYGPNSFAAYAKDGRDLYLEQLYSVDQETDWFDAPMDDNRGVWVRTDEAVSIEFYTPGNEQEQGQRQAAKSAEPASEEGRSSGSKRIGDAE